MEWKIGEIRQIKGEWYQCIDPKKYGCSYCDLENKCIDDIKGKVAACHARYRSDGKCVVFKKLEKVGKPHTTSNDKVMQNYLIEAEVSEYPKDVFILTNYGQRIIAIEIKQNKEDMEENKISLPKEDNALTRIVCAYVNGKISDKELIDAIKEMSDEYPYDKNSLKPFSLELAKSGKPVCTRDGRKARIICFDVKGDICPIIALVEENGIEAAYHYDNNGQNAYNKSELDLMMLPEKKSGWANIVKGSDGYPHMGRGIFQSKEAAENAIKAFSSKLIDTVKVEWYE